jgi:lysine 2,3-aminomutase
MEAFRSVCGNAALPRLLSGFTLTEPEKAFFVRSGGEKAFPFHATEYLLSLIDPDNPADPIRRQIVPTVREFDVSGYEKDDPLAEARFTVAPHHLRRDADRCIFKVAPTCAVHCRFCFRKGLLGTSARDIGRTEAGEAARYLGRHPEIREVLLTGGDPLTIAPDRLEEIMAGLRKQRPDIGLRIGTRLPVADPERLTGGLAVLLERYRPLWVTVHCNHPAELATPAAAALSRLSSRGIRLGGQSVLLAGVNDDAATLAGLFRRQRETGIVPYYLFHLDPAPGTSHFRVPLARGLELMAELRARFPEVRPPVYALDLPDGGGKVKVADLRIEPGLDGGLLLRDPQGKTHRYPIL